MASRQSVFVLQPGGIGDGLLSLVALQSLRPVLESMEVTFSGHPALESFSCAAGHTQQFLPLTHPYLRALFHSGPSQEAMEYWHKLERIIAWLPWWTATFEANLARLHLESLIIAPQEPFVPDLHVAHHLARTLTPMGGNGQADLTAPLLMLGRRWQSDEWSCRIRSRMRLAVCIGSSRSYKNWPISAFAELCSMCEHELDAQITLIMGPREESVHSPSALRAFSPNVQRVTSIPLAEVAELLLTHSVYVGNDTGVSHLAALIGVPTVVLFGSTAPERWAPIGPRVHSLRSRPLSHLTVGTVFDAISNLCERTASSGIADG